MGLRAGRDGEVGQLGATGEGNGAAGGHGAGQSTLVEIDRTAGIDVGDVDAES
jgi:hypothetical protein